MPIKFCTVPYLLLKGAFICFELSHPLQTGHIGILGIELELACG